MKNAKTAPIKIYLKPFHVDAELADGNACGGWDENFTAELALECETLNKDGFVLENQTIIRSIRKFFAGKKYIASCEQLCQCIARLCYDMAPDRLNTIHVKVYNLTGHLEVTWTRGLDVPPLAVCVTGSVESKNARRD
jgi:hypothetical protein